MPSSLSQTQPCEPLLGSGCCWRMFVPALLAPYLSQCFKTFIDRNGLSLPRTNPRESWGQFTCRNCPAWSACEWGTEQSPSCNSGLEIVLPLGPFTWAAQVRLLGGDWLCTVLVFSIENPADFLPSGAREPHAQWVTAFPWTQKGKLMVCSGEWLFLGKNSWTRTCCHFFLGYKGRETIIDQEEKPKQAKLPKPGFHEPPQERGLFSVWFPTQQ